MDSSNRSSGLAQLSSRMGSRFQHVLDKLTPHAGYRWAIFLCVVTMYAIRVYFLKGFYIVTYGLGIYLLNRLIGFLSPMVDPELEGPTLPTASDAEFKPFVRRLPEFKFCLQICGGLIDDNDASPATFWYSCTKAFVIAFCMTFFSVFDVPVFWPILLMYWMVLFFITMKRQIRHMLKHRYIPFSLGKKVYKGKGAPMPDGKGKEPAGESSHSK